MAPSKTHQPTFTTALLPPPGANTRPTIPTRTIPNPTTNPSILNDAFAVRLEVFVDEQKCAPEIEIDEDDNRCWHWVIYDTQAAAPASEKIPVAVIRLVPPPHPSHGEFVAAHGEGAAGNDGVPNGNIEEQEVGLQREEPYIKFGRVAVVSSYRGFGLGRMLMETAMKWAAENAGEINRALVSGLEEEEKLVGSGAREVPVWKGLALVHAQVQVEGLYKAVGFVTDEKMGKWIEDGIEHVGMWKRLDCKA